MIGSGMDAIAILKSAAEHAKIERASESYELTGKCYACGRSLEGTGNLFYCPEHTGQGLQREVEGLVRRSSGGTRAICRDDLAEQVHSIEEGQLILVVPEHECEFYTDKPE